MDLINARELALLEMAKYPELADWEFKFSNGLRQFGLCDFNKKTITLSRYLTALNTDDEVLDTILHEIAHALIHPKHGHDEVWKATAVRVGARPERCFGSHVIKPPHKYNGTCDTCGLTIKCYRRSKGLFHPACGINSRIVFEKIK